MAAELQKQGMIQLHGDYAAATPALMERSVEFEAKLMKALDFTKPTFNEDMRHGHTNM